MVVVVVAAEWTLLLSVSSFFFSFWFNSFRSLQKGVLRNNPSNKSKADHLEEKEKIFFFLPGPPRLRRCHFLASAGITWRNGAVTVCFGDFFLGASQLFFCCWCCRRAVALPKHFTYAKRGNCWKTKGSEVQFFPRMRMNDRACPFIEDFFFCYE
ncbi:hypothetical protein TCDM_05530 [Trypanosoma cruzi Dm28c]|uniref:Uncharacterized protein n=1 Tax=Trypanosoma cruzi Dm28c TaxID=1416333 RepID=V5BDW0_TRYCR|nr:hypothetical protein TCDM_05530 [Trypanosoma cruzi Dm28c]